MGGVAPCDGSNKTHQRLTVLREDLMSKSKIARFVGGAVAAAAALALSASAEAQEKKIKIGVVYDLTRPFAGGGSGLQYTGPKIMIGYFIKQCGGEDSQVQAVPS